MDDSTSASAAPSKALAPTAGDKADKAGKAGKKKGSGYKVREGITFGSAIGPPNVQYAITNKIIATIQHASKDSEIRIMTWNFRAPRAVDALLAAQRRGVRVLLLIDGANASRLVPNPYFHRLQVGLKRGNAHRSGKNRSHAIRCSHACRRDARGAAHSKYYLFSKVGRSKDVLMQGSANLTTAASQNQWNEIFTYVNQPALFDFAEKIHKQMWQDKAVRAPWASATTGKKDMTLYFSPQLGPDFHGDPLEKALRQVKCTGAVGAGRNGRTVVRAAPDVIRGNRGLRAARLLRGLWAKGCDVRIGYTVMGKSVSRYLAHSSRGPVPKRHLVQDFDGDGQFDNYFHLKVFTINGVMGKDRSAFWSMNGSTNTSELASNSDENIGVFKKKSVTLTYQRYIDRWYNNPPRSSRPLPGSRNRNVDPYANVDMD